MLPRSKRLNIKLFKETIMKGNVFHGSFFIIRCQNSQFPSRFGVSIPKKVAKNAVDRNKIRRRVYSIIEKLESRLISNKNIVFIMKNGAEIAEFGKITEEIEKSFVKMGILK